MDYYEELDLTLAEDMGYSLQCEPIREVALWRAVMARAINDAIGKDIKQGQQVSIIQCRAQRWIYEGDNDFRKVCQYAGLDAEEVHFKVLDFITRPTSSNTAPNSRTMKRFKHRLAA